MRYIYLLLTVLTISTSSIFGTYYNRKNEGKRSPTELYLLLQSVAVALFWTVLYVSDMAPFDVKVIPYAILFALSFTVCNVGIIRALLTGPTSLTTLFVTLSLIITTIYGFFDPKWDTPFNAIVAIGLVLVVISIVLCLYTGKKEEKKISFRWIIFVLMACFGNAGCSIVQTNLVKSVPEEECIAYGKMLMAFATLLVFLSCLVLYLISNKKDSKVIARRSWYFPVLAGACNVVLNFCIMMLTGKSLLPSSLIFPVVGVGELVVVMLFSIFAFKERLKWWQWVGIGVGAVATVLLSI